MPQMRLVMKCASRGSLPFMKMLYPRKMEEVLWHWATFLASKSILVKMPRLPTMRVIGSQFISTKFFDLLGTSFVGAVIVPISIAPFRSCSFLFGPLSSSLLSRKKRWLYPLRVSARRRLVASRVIARSQLRSAMPPLRLLIHRFLRNRTQRPDRPAIDGDARARNSGSRRLIHEGHELVGKSRHGASNADSPHIRTAANARHPAALRHVAVHYRSPASELHDAFRRAIHFREIALLVIAGPVATVMHGASKQPGRTQFIVQRNHRRQPRHLIQKVEHGLHKIVRLHRTSRHVHNRQPSLRFPIPSEVIGQPHATSRIAFHGMDAAIGSAGPDGNDRQCLRRQTVDPLIGGDRLPGFRIRSEPRPISFLFDL